MAVDDLVEKRLGEADCAVILATADDNVGGRMQPRPNVLHEIGLAQQRLDNRIIYLKEVGCDFPSNVAPKVWENFTQDNMEAAFEKIAKELQAFRLL
jgi:predicted nucleotide-binding protein